MKNYKHLLFDLDQTLWDFESNCAEAIAELYVHFGMQKYLHPDPVFFIEIYKKVNKAMWRDYHRGLTDKATLRNQRFPKTFEMAGITAQELAKEFNEAFMELCPTKTNLLPFAKEVLDYLKKKYTLHILTNGFRESQYIKLSGSGISHYFENVFSSEGTGFLKPDKKIFDHVVAALNCTYEECLMIGDDLEADVIGAKHAGMDQVFYNRTGEVHEEKITFEINCLSELKNIL